MGIVLNKIEYDTRHWTFHENRENDGNHEHDEIHESGSKQWHMICLHNPVLSKYHQLPDVVDYGAILFSVVSPLDPL